jgi:cyanate permease
LLAATGLGLALVSALPTIAITGFALMGLGLSAVFPLTLRASSTHEAAPGPALAAVSTLGYAGFLTGPPVIGLVADATNGLRLALTLVCAVCVITALFAAHRDKPRAVPQKYKVSGIR